MQMPEDQHQELKVLIVDDFASMRDLIRKSLLRLGFSKISMATGAVDAVRQIEAGGEFDLIISDWNMPNMTGLELLNYVRTEKQLKNIPFLMITAEAQRENIIEAAKAGVSQYIVKPFTEEALQEKIESILPR
jgi:two-component system chemotaxis response regulator CheY